VQERTPLVLLLAFFASFSWTKAPVDNGGAVLGRVFELGAGSPVARAAVTARNQEDGSEKTVLAAADGTFFIAPLAPGQHAIRATCAGYRQNALPGHPVRCATAAGPVNIGLARFGSGQESADGNSATPQTMV